MVRFRDIFRRAKSDLAEKSQTRHSLCCDDNTADVIMGMSCKRGPGPALFAGSGRCR